MGRKCVVPDCSSEEGRPEDRGVTFHKIPLHSDIRPKWMSLCHIPEDKHNVKVVHVCSRHFLKADFCNFKGKKYLLRQGVLPSVFPWNKLKKDVTPTIEVLAPGTTKSPPIVKEESKEDVKIEIKQEPMEVESTSSAVPEEIKIKQEDCSIVKSESAEEIVQPQVADSTAKVKSSTTIEQKGKSVQTPYGNLNFGINARLEALDFNQMWFPAKVIEVDYEESEVLIHFEKYSSKYDEWISMNSSRLRPLQPVAKKPIEIYSVGEKCLASWSDTRKFPACVTKVVDNDAYEVMFNDGLVKTLKAHRLAKVDGKSIGSAPLFDPAEGTKQDRREKKRKLNVAQLFRKRSRVDDDGSHSSHNTSLPVTSSSSSSNIIENATPEKPLNWTLKWEKGRPVGTESVIETSDGLRKSIIVADPRLPPNWQKHLSQRIHGASAGKWDSFIMGPDGRRFRTRAEMKTFIEENPQLNFTEAMFDFGLHRRSKPVRRSAPAVPVEPPPVPVEPVPEPQPEEENPKLFKIPLVDDVYRCPIEGCGKSFRRENLAQMHVKHYHPKFTKFLDSTPNVADLAYARTVGESLDKSPDRVSRPIPLRQPQKVVTSKAAVTKITQSPTVESDVKTPVPPPNEPKSKDVEILKLLNTKPSHDEPKYPAGLPSNMYPDFKLKDLLNKSEGVPASSEVNLKISATNTSRSTGIKTLLPVVRSTEKKEVKDDKGVKSTVKRRRESEQAKLKEVEPTPSTSIKQEPQPPPPPPAPPKTPLNYIVEGGEVIKIVQMKQEEIINCTCGYTEEDGLMIQCELCLCWQHAYCNNIERENQVPEKYICYICQNPMKQRSSRKYCHDQDWLKTGTLPVANYHCKDSEALRKRFEKLKKSHDLTGALLELKDFLHTLKVKTKVAEVKNHPKLYLWSKPWEKHPLPEKLDVKNEDIKQQEIQPTKSEIDLLSGKCDSQSDSMLLSILKSAKDEQKLKDDLDLNNLIDNNLEQLPMPVIPQPEAAIETADCKLNLLDHIAHCQTLVEERLNDFEAEIDALDGGGNNSEEDFSRTCQTVQMLLRDLSTLKDLGQSSSL